MVSLVCVKLMWKLLMSSGIKLILINFVDLMVKVLIVSVKSV